MDSLCTRVRGICLTNQDTFIHSMFMMVHQLGAIKTGELNLHLVMSEPIWLANLICLLRVRTGPWKPGKSWNFKIWIQGLESPGIFVEVLESPGICTYRSIFLIISIQEFSHYTSEIWLYVCTLRVREFNEKVLEFDIGRSWKVLESEMSKFYEPCYC